ncbi:ARM repeat-containing protein [Phlebopus sp. FC_14]|nr:ARM repeat-containing protein [Phlebopus sp. FC_14]
MESVERSVRSWMASGKDAEVDQVAQGISLSGVTLLDVVKALGEYLTSEDDGLRAKGVRFLSLVLERCPKDKLNRQAVRVLATFYCSKLEDIETITPALQGLSHLVKFPLLSSSDISDIFSALFVHVKMKALVQSTRFFVYSIVDSLMSSHRADLKNMGDQFLAGYAALASGEKDPRNLLLAFAIARVILAEFHVEKHVEDYFDITFCYFPITFRPPPDDPYGISAEDLKMSLRDCLSAIEAFGPLGIPVFLEKLVAGSPTTKRDTLEAMSACLPVYGPSAVREFGRKIWSALKLEIFQSTDLITEGAALNTLRVFMCVIQEDAESRNEGKDNGIDTLVRNICSDCIDVIGEPEKIQAKAALKVLCILSVTSPRLSSHVIPQVVEKLVKIFHDPMEIMNRAAVTILLTDLLNALIPPTTTSDISTSPSQALKGFFPPVMQADFSALTFVKDSILGLFIVGLSATPTRLPALQGLSALTRIPFALTDEELGYIVLEAGKFVGKEQDEIEDVTADVLLLLTFIANLAPQHLAMQTLPSLFAALPDRAPPRNAQFERAAYWRVLCALGALCVHPTLFETLVIRLTAKLELLCSPSPVITATLPGDVADCEDIECVAAYAHAILATLANTLSTKVSKPRPDPDVPKYAEHLLPNLQRLFLQASVTTGGAVLSDPRLLLVGGRIIRLVAETLNVDQQYKLIAAMTAAYLHGQVKAVTGGEFTPASEEFRPMHVDANTHQRDTMVLFAAAHFPIRKEIRVAVPNLSMFLKELVGWCGLPTCSTLQREVVSQLLATLVNKYAESITEFLNYELDSYWSAVLKNPNVPLEARRHAINTWVWITKALLVRSHPMAPAFIDSLFTLLDDQGLDWNAARALGVLATPDDILTKRNGAVLKILHSQKYFNSVLPKILTGAKNINGSGQEKANLVALASLINAVPKSMYSSHLSTLIPLLLRGLDLADPVIRSHIIDTLANNIDAASGANDPLSPYASTLVLAMLKNCVVADIPDPRVRISALKYLAVLPSAIRYDLLHPYKARVLKELGKVLDDPRRAVRKEAVNARTNWFKFNG